MCRKFIKSSDMRDLVNYAEGFGYSVELTRNKHLKFTLPGVPPVFTSSTPSDRRSWANCRALLKRLVGGLVAA